MSEMPIVDKITLISFFLFVCLAPFAYAVALTGGFGKRFKISFWSLTAIEGMLFIAVFSSMIVGVILE